MPFQLKHSCISLLLPLVAFILQHHSIATTFPLNWLHLVTLIALSYKPDWKASLVGFNSLNTLRFITLCLQLGYFYLYFYQMYTFGRLVSLDIHKTVNLMCDNQSVMHLTRN